MGANQSTADIHNAVDEVEQSMQPVSISPQAVSPCSSPTTPIFSAERSVLDSVVISVLTSYVVTGVACAACCRDSMYL